MAYDESLAGRVREAFARRRGADEKKMFGGVGFLLDGSMCIGVWKQFLIARVGPTGYEAALERPFVKEFDITGRPMKGWVMVEADGVNEDDELLEWIDLAVKFVRSLPKT